MTPKQNPDLESLVARMIAELQENPEAQRMLLRALLTNEFLGMPARLDRIEKDIAELKIDVAELKTTTKELKTDVAELKTTTAELKTTTRKLVDDVGELKGDALETRVHRKIRSVICQALNLRRPHVVQSAFQSPAPDFDEAVGRAAEDGRISDGQEARIVATDVILRARRRSERTPTWVAIEVSHRVEARDVDRSRDTADALAAVFGESVIAAVAGRQIDPTDRKRAADAGVTYVHVPA